jgi:hypothetical protein
VTRRRGEVVRVDRRCRGVDSIREDQTVRENVNRSLESAIVGVAQHIQDRFAESASCDNIQLNNTSDKQQNGSQEQDEPGYGVGCW